jgi:nicotinate-nucleotide adenylyltransferase
LSPLAILGGTFDPVHFGHLGLASEVRDALALDGVRLVPSADPPHRHPPRASAADRVAMLRLAVADAPGLTVDTREITRGGKSYTVDTLADLRAEMPARPLVLLVGADAFHGFPGWHRWRTLFDLAHIVVVPRPGVGLERGLSPELLAAWQQRRVDDPQLLRERPAGTIYVQPVTAQPISSSFIRSRLAAGAPSVEIAGLLPASVLAYIESHRLYRHVTHAD